MTLRKLTLLAALLYAPNAFATITMEIQFGSMRDSATTTLPATALWAVIYDDNNDGVLPGGLEANSSLTNLDAATANAVFLGVRIEEGAMVSGDRILKTGSVGDQPGSGNLDEVWNFDPSSAGLNLEPGRRWALFCSRI